MGVETGVVGWGAFESAVGGGGGWFEGSSLGRGEGFGW